MTTVSNNNATVNPFATNMIPTPVQSNPNPFATNVVNSQQTVNPFATNVLSSSPGVQQQQQQNAERAAASLREKEDLERQIRELEAKYASLLEIFRKLQEENERLRYSFNNSIKLLFIS
jgi:hypothetical protein